jgi:hypothetical protein
MVSSYAFRTAFSTVLWKLSPNDRQKGLKIDPDKALIVEAMGPIAGTEPLGVVAARRLELRTYGL